MKTNWFLRLFGVKEKSVKQPYVAESLTIDPKRPTTTLGERNYKVASEMKPESVTVEAISTKWVDRELKTFVTVSYRRVKYDWKKDPKRYNVCFTSNSGFKLLRTSIPCKAHDFYVGNLKELYNQDH